MFAGIASGVGSLLARISAARAGYIDALNIGTGKKVPNGTDDYTATRATYLTDMKNQLPAGGAVIASSTEVAKASVWTSTLATKMGGVVAQPQVSRSQVLAVRSWPSVTIEEFIPGYSAYGGISSAPISSDGAFGYRRGFLNYNAVVGNYQTVIDTGFGATGKSGWLLGFMCCSYWAVTHGIRLSLYNSGSGLDVVGESDYVARTSMCPATLLGYAAQIDPGILASRFLLLNPIPLRFNYGFKAELKANDNNLRVHSIVIWTDDPA